MNVSNVVEPDVSIVVVNWNVKDFLRNCLRSIMQETDKPYEIIIVDNASGDGTVQMVEAEFPDVALIANSRNLGFAAANNQGIRASSGRYLLLLNPDTIVLDGAIDKMIDWCDRHPEVGCAGCQVFETATVIQRTCFSDPSPLNTLLVEAGLHSLFPKSHFFGAPEYSWWDRMSEKAVDVVSGMFMLIPRSVFDQVGLLDESFFIYAEEADLCRRIRHAGFLCVFTPIARILHLEGGDKSTSQIKAKMYLQLQKSMMIYIRKYYGFLGVMVTRSIYVYSKFFRLCLFGAIAKIFGGVEMKARSNLAGVSLAFHLFGLEPDR
jgi:GT2 family glycosyltransferase